MEMLGRDRGCPELGLPALGSLLWSREAVADLAGSQIANHDLLDAIRALAFTIEGNVRRAVDYKNLGPEELGSIYESLLELHPELNADAGTFALTTAAGHERKTTGSYYTPPSLVAQLLDTALDPVLDEAASKPDPEAAILGLKVCDPAAGSGHFLIAAAHRIAKRLASVRTGDEEPSPEALRRALRDVIGRCVYGVDVNPMSVELCKVSLWMEALEPGRPLSYLDHHIQCGNSLLGATPSLLARGIPDEAYKPIEGDDNAACRDLRKQNRDERRGQATMFDRFESQSIRPHERLAEAMTSIDAVEDQGIEGVQTKEQRFRSLLRSTDYVTTGLLANAWCAAFVVKKTPTEPSGSRIAITQSTTDRIESREDGIDTAIRLEIERLVDQYRFLHWHLAFPDVFRPLELIGEGDILGWHGGFDVVLGNPPWERIKIQKKEWFAERRPEVAAAPNAAARDRMIESLIEDDPALHRAFLEDSRRAEGESHIVRSSGRYPLCGRGDVNTFSIFAELNRQLCGSSGRVGCVVPSGIASDDTTKFFFQDLVKSQALVSLYSFENEEFLFPGVHHSTKFCLLTLTGPDHPSTQADFVYFARQTEQLQEEDRHFTLSGADMAQMNPNTGTCPIFRSKRDAEINKAIYRRVPVLIQEGPPEVNSWGISFLRMLDMANDSGLFRTQQQLEADGWTLDGNIFRRDEKAYLPLFEAKMVHHFDHRLGTYEGQTEAQANQGTLPPVTEAQHADPDFVTMPRYWVPASELEGRLRGRWDHTWLLGWRDVCRNTDTRTMICSLLSVVGVGHKLPIMLPGQSSPAQSACLYANLASYCLDYVARQKMGGTSLSYFHLKQFPILPPEAYDQSAGWSPGLSYQKWLLPRVLELTYTAWDLRSFAHDCGYDGPPFRWDAARRFLLRCELDAAFFHLYGLGRDDAANILDTFPVVRRKDEDQYGEYRTQRVILEIYDRMAEAVRTGVPYQTLLDPPPADPRVAHLPRGAARRAGDVYELIDLASAHPTETSIRIRLPPGDQVEECDAAGVARFRILRDGVPRPARNATVILRHADLRRGESAVPIAAGKWNWMPQRDAETGEAIVLITLRSGGLPAQLVLSEHEWERFRPLAVLES
jgi:hypothetical protein